MTMSFDQHQVSVAIQTEAMARRLVHASQDIPVPGDSLRLIHELGATVEHLKDTSYQLARWHQNIDINDDHMMYRDESSWHEPEAISRVIQHLSNAVGLLELASAAISDAENASSRLTWPRLRPDEM